MKSKQPRTAEGSFQDLDVKIERGKEQEIRREQKGPADPAPLMGVGIFENRFDPQTRSFGTSRRSLFFAGPGFYREDPLICF